MHLTSVFREFQIKLQNVLTMEVYAFYFTLSFLFWSCSVVKMQIIDNLDGAADFSKYKEIIDFVGVNDIELSNSMIAYIQQSLDQKGIKNEIPYMNVVSCLFTFSMCFQCLLLSLILLFL